MLPNSYRTVWRAAVLALAAAISALADEAPDSSEERPVEAVSLLGQPLSRPVLSAEFRDRQKELLRQAQNTLDNRPDDPEALIWVGRRWAYLGAYRRAVWFYSRGTELFPNDPRFYRHRGHRYLTLRRLDDAIRDFEHAAELVAGHPDRVEPDGLPNAHNVPTSTLQTNIWYHLGLAHYLKQDFEAALAAYRNCLEVSKNPDMLVATSYWLHMTLRRLGRDEEAARVLEPIHDGMEILENGAYHQLLLMARGERSPDELLETARQGGSSTLATTGYGVGNWHLIHGQKARAREIFREIVATDAWPSFGYIAAEAELRDTHSKPEGI